MRKIYEKCNKVRNDTSALVEKKTEHWKICCQDMEYHFYGMQKEIWKVVRGQTADMKSGGKDPTLDWGSSPQFEAVLKSFQMFPV